MVPMLTWVLTSVKFLLSHYFLLELFRLFHFQGFRILKAIMSILLTGLGNDLLRNRLRYFTVVVEFHRVVAAALGKGTQVSYIAEHF